MKINQLNQLKQDYLKIKEKIEYLVAKFNNSSEMKALYIFSPGDKINIKTIKNIRDSLIINRNGNKKFILFCIVQNRPFEDFENIIVKEGFQMKGCWEGGDDSTRWKEILDQFKFTPDIWQ